MAARLLFRPPARLSLRTLAPHRTMATTPASLPAGTTFFVDSFLLRQWDAATAGTALPATVSPADILARVEAAHAAGDAPLVDGYAPFCKHVFVRAWFDVAPGALAITPANAHLLRSGYSSRRPEELAVLSRWFDEADVRDRLGRAEWLDVILYSADQLAAEAAALPAGERVPLPPGVPWGIISVKAQAEPHETPMTPITAMRNALGREEGGSGVPIDRDAYAAAVAYWQAHAAVVRGGGGKGE